MLEHEVSLRSVIYPSLGHRRCKHDLSAPGDILVTRVISLATSSASAIFVVCHLIIIIIVLVVINVVVVVVIITQG
jgi:hypothetical protein